MHGNRLRSATLMFSWSLVAACGSDGKGSGSAATDGAATDGAATDGAVTDGAATDGAATDGTATGGPATDGATTGGMTTGTGTGGPPPGPPGGINLSLTTLPGDEPTACEWEWSIRSLAVHTQPWLPRRMYFSACDTASDTPKMVTSLTLGENAQHPEEDPSSGGIVVAQLDPDTSTLQTTDMRHFPECIAMHGVATSADCSTIAALCRIPSATQGFDKDVLATHNAADWMTNPYECGDRGLNDEMWLYEWTNGDIQSEPQKYIVQKSIGSWELGTHYLRYGESDNTYGIAVKATVGGDNGSTCHEADSFLILDRTDYSYTNRGWSWACGTGHTITNRPAYNPSSNQYAMLCSTDYNEAEEGGLGAFVFHADGEPAREFHYMSIGGLAQKGTGAGVVPRPDGGFLGAIVGVDGDIPAGEYNFEPPTSIGLGQWDAQGNIQGEINWVIKNPDAYVSFASLSPLSSDDTYVLGWGVMQRLADEEDGLNKIIPWEYWLMEIDGDGNALTDPLRVEGAGWGDFDEMVPLGDGRVGWAYIADPALQSDGSYPDCNQPELQLTVYTAAG